MSVWSLPVNYERFDNEVGYFIGSNKKPECVYNGQFSCYPLDCASLTRVSPPKISKSPLGKRSVDRAMSFQGKKMFALFEKIGFS